MSMVNCNLNKSADANNIPRQYLKSIMVSKSKVKNEVKGHKPPKRHIYTPKACVCAIWKQSSKRFPKYRPENESFAIN